MYNNVMMLGITILIIMATELNIFNDNATKMHDYFIELPNFMYDREALFLYQHHITMWKPNVHLAKAGVDPSKKDISWFDYYPNKDLDILQEITSSINLDLTSKPYKFTAHQQGGSLPFHRDPQRECVLMLPLTDTPEGLQWINGKREVIADHVYTCPTVINAKIMHGCPIITKDRILLQVDIPCSWETLKQNYKYIFKVPA